MRLAAAVVVITSAASATIVRSSRRRTFTRPTGAIVNGAGSGFGRGIAARYAEEGARVVVNDIHRANGEATVAAIGTAARFCPGDVSKDADVAHLVAFALDTFFNEKDLSESGAVKEVVGELAEGDNVYERDGAVWLATSSFGDDKDRVLVKGDGSFTYMAPDLAYHRDKWERGFRTAVDVLGADHAGYPPRVRAGLVALGLTTAAAGHPSSRRL